MAPGKTHIMTDELTDFFNKMQAEVLTIASNKTTDSSQVITIDMYTGFSDNLWLMMFITMKREQSSSQKNTTVFL